MSVVPYPSASGTGAPPPSTLAEALNENARLREDNARLCREAAQLREERTALFAALTNEHLTVAEKLDTALLLFEAYHNGQKAPRPDAFFEVCITAVAGRAKRSVDAVSKTIERLEGFGFLQKKTEWRKDEQLGQTRPFVCLRPPGKDLRESLQVLARLAPTDEERAAVTELKEGRVRTKPGPAKGEKREKVIKRRCPDCGSEDTELRCRNCGSIHHTDDMPNESAGADEESQSITYGSDSGEAPRSEREPHHAADAAINTFDHRAVAPAGPDHEPYSVTYGSRSTDPSGRPDLSRLSGPDTPPLEAALNYAELGWHVFPARGKEPLTAHGHKEATTDPEVIRRWWTRWPRANIGCSCGPSCLAVFDIDPDGWENWSSFERMLDLPLTLRSRTGRGGEHVFFRPLPGVEIRNSVGKLAPGVDVRAVDGYVVLPPSVHPNGKRYAWVEQTRAGIYEIPRALLQRLGPPRRTLGPPPGGPPADMRAVDDLITGDPIPEGERNEKLASIAGSLINRGAWGSQLEELLLQANENRCRPMLDDDEVLDVAQSVQRTHVRNHGAPPPNGGSPLPQSVSLTCPECGKAGTGCQELPHGGWLCSQYQGGAR
jgi:hypothetical protein